MASNTIKTKKALTCSVITKEGPVIRSMKIEHIRNSFLCGLYFYIFGALSLYSERKLWRA